MGRSLRGISAVGEPVAGKKRSGVLETLTRGRVRDMNTATAIAQIASPIVNLIFIMVLGVGYYFQWKVSRKTLDEMREERISGGRPQVIVDDDYGRLPNVDLAIRNVSSGPAKEISFEFSSPVESSDGTVISDLPYFKDGLDFLAPDGRISLYWDHLDDLLPLLKEKGLEGGITVTTRYKDLAGEYYETEWNLNPSVYRQGRYVQHSGMDDLVRNVAQIKEAVEEIPGKIEESVGRQEDFRVAKDGR